MDNLLLRLKPDYRYLLKNNPDTPSELLTNMVRYTNVGKLRVTEASILTKLVGVDLLSIGDIFDIGVIKTYRFYKEVIDKVLFTNIFTNIEVGIIPYNVLITCKSKLFNIDGNSYDIDDPYDVVVNIYNTDGKELLIPYFVIGIKENDITDIINYYIDYKV